MTQGNGSDGNFSCWLVTVLMRGTERVVRTRPHVYLSQNKESRSSCAVGMGHFHALSSCSLPNVGPCVGSVAGLIHRVVDADICSDLCFLLDSHLWQTYMTGLTVWLKELELGPEWLKQSNRNSNFSSQSVFHVETAVQCFEFTLCLK